MRGKVYLLNTLIVPINFDKYEEAEIEVKRITKEEFCKTIKDALREGKLVNAIGHEGTAKLIAEMCEIPLKAERKTVFFKEGDIGLHIFLKQRLPEGVVLTKEELEKLPMWLVKSKVINIVEKR